VVGASRRRGSIGGLIFRHLLANGFAGTAYPVNRSATAVHGVRAYPSLTELPEPADLVVIAVPAAQVQTVAEDALRAGARGLVVVASGFAEAGPEGEARQGRLVEAVRAHGARLVGPNCLGLLNTDPQIRLDASLAPALPPVGRIGFFSHSAALGIVILQHAAERGLGFSTFVSAGNRADVSGNDLLQYWEEDPATDVAMLYLEAFGNPRRFARVARRVALKKPVLCVKSARSRAGRAAARAHIGARPLADVEVDALFQQAGVTRVDTLEELFDTALLLAHQPLPRGETVAILGNSGGAVTIAADACEARGMAVGGAFDLGPLAGPEDYRKAVQDALADDRADAAIAIFLCVSECEPQLIVRGIRRGVLGAETATGIAKPVLLCLMGTSGAVDVSLGSAAGRRTVFPSYRFPEAAARALAHVVDYARFRGQPAGRLLWYEDVDPGAARSQLEPLLAAGTADLQLSAEQSRALLGCFGVPIAPAGVGAHLVVALRQHPDFGPLLSLRRAGRGGVERITPLTDQDARAMLAGSGVAGDGGEGELLGRLSQMIEELPWLAELRAVLVPGVGGSTAALAAGLRIVVSAPRSPVARTGEV
jgi:acyl-CoA synthetase (NDP forming)